MPPHACESAATCAQPAALCAQPATLRVQVFPLVLFLLEEMELQVEESFVTALAGLAAQIDLASANGAAPPPPPPPSSRSNNRRLVQGRAPPKGNGRMRRQSDGSLRADQSIVERPERYSYADPRHARMPTERDAVGRGGVAASQAAPAPSQPQPPPMWVGEQTPLAKVCQVAIVSIVSPPR